MGFYTYTILTGTKAVEGSIRNWVNSTKPPAGAILAEAEAFIYTRLRVREMIETTTLTFADGDSEKALPAGFQAPIWLKFFGDTDPLPYVHEQMLRRSLDEDGDLIESIPQRWTTVASEIWLDVKHDGGNDAEFVFMGTPDALSGSNTTNFLTNRFPTLLLEACLMGAYRYLKDDAQMTQARVRFEAELREANKTFDLARFTQELMR